MELECVWIDNVDDAQEFTRKMWIECYLLLYYCIQLLKQFVKCFFFFSSRPFGMTTNDTYVGWSKKTIWQLGFIMWCPWYVCDFWMTCRCFVVIFGPTLPVFALFVSLTAHMRLHESHLKIRLNVYPDVAPLFMEWPIEVMYEFIISHICT